MAATDRRPDAPISALVVDDDGLRIEGRGDFAVNVVFGEQRVLSFWLERDTVARDGTRFFAWPAQLKRFLNGAVTVSLRSPVDGSTWISADAVLGDGQGVVAVVDGQGRPLGMDKSMKLHRLFGDSDRTAMEPLAAALDDVLAALERAGVQPFVAYGTLLGAVRDGDFIGHDSDADIGYVSQHAHPVDAIRESFALQRRLLAMGYRVQRYSGLGLKVLVREGESSWRGLDVFGGFLRDDMLYLMGEVGHPFRSEWLHPRGTARLGEREVPVPAQPEHLLEAMYGPSWRVPDPAYKFTTLVSTQRRLDGWFRGLRTGLEVRWRRFRARSEPVATAPSTFAAWAHAQSPAGACFVDVGCGRGLDVVWLAERGDAARVVGLDYFAPDLRLAERGVGAAAGEGRVVRDRVELTWLNLAEIRSVMETIARLSRTPGPRVVLAHHVLDATEAHARRNFLRLARVLTREGGRCFLQVQVAPTARSRAWRLRALDRDELAALIAAAGGTIEHELLTSELEVGLADPEDEGAAAPAIMRMVVSWHR
ncbi:hypothetical protein [Nocardioides sp.]|uniref:hypothetical protein n=1 Tax=Nocardioides sp. TaxID=35761 RepID=UPI003518C0A7